MGVFRDYLRTNLLLKMLVESVLTTAKAFIDELKAAIVGYKMLIYFK